MHTLEITAILDAIRKIVQVLREGATSTQTQGMTPAQVFALRQLSRQTPLSVNDLAALTFTHQSSVSVVVRRLAERGLVEHSPSPEDGRRVQLTLTAAGARLLKKLPHAPQERIVAGIENMPAAKRRALITGLAALLETMGIPKNSRPPMFFETAPARRRKRRAS